MLVMRGLLSQRDKCTGLLLAVSHVRLMHARVCTAASGADLVACMTQLLARHVRACLHCCPPVVSRSVY
jgi:hypothetical protein